MSVIAMQNHSVRNLARVDFTLLVLFEALLAERNVTRAAARVGIAQPSASKALDRLRRLFDDPLFVRAPEGMRPTPRALELAPDVAAVVERVRALVAAELPFEPASAHGEVRIAMSDAAEFVLLPKLHARLAREAPGVTLRARALDKDRAYTELDAERLDAVVGVFDDVPKRFGTHALFEEHFVCLARADHPALRDGLTLEAYATLPHLLVTLRDDARGAVDEALARAGRTRHVQAIVARFLSVPAMLQHSDAIATLPSRFAAAFGGRCASYPPPVPVRSWTEMLLWPRARERDARATWLRRVIREVAGEA